MSRPPRLLRLQDRLVSFFWSGEVIRSRSVGVAVLSGTVALPALPPRLLADWARETSLRLGLEAGDVDALSLPRARARWPDYRHCVQTVADHDGAHYGGAAFCNLFLSEDRGLDLHFPACGHRIPLARGTVVVFDTGQPHAVIDRHGTGFDAADFPSDRDRSQVFLTWELPIESADVARVLRIDFDVDPSIALRLDEEQVWLDGAPASVCPACGRWRTACDCAA